MNPKLVRAHIPKISVALACSMLVNGCAVDPKTGNASLSETFASEDPCANNARNIGIALGTVVGAVVGHQMDHRSGKFFGAAAGALVGGFIGADMDKKRCELAKVAKQYSLDMSFAVISSEGSVLDDAALKANRNADTLKQTAIGNVVSIRDQAADGGHFLPDSDKLTPRAQLYFAAIAQSYNGRKTAEGIQNRKAREDYIQQLSERKLLLVGHTDDTGSSKYNAELSERRARSVARFLSDHGIPINSLYFQGAGESYPLADNASEEGRSRNRRVEFVELAGDVNLRKYLEARTPKYEYYRPIDVARSKDSVVAAQTLNAKPQERLGALTAASIEKPKLKDDVRAQPTARSSPTAKSATLPAVGSSLQVTSPTGAPTNASNIGMQGTSIDFGGVPLNQAVALTDVGKVDAKRGWFSLISPAYANEPAVLRDCSQDRPREAGAVRSLRDNKQYETSEHLPGLYGKTWTDKVNGHQVVINKVSVLRNDATVANLPEFKVYKNYNPVVNRNPAPDIVTAPAVNTYLGSNGVLYRMFLNGNAGLQCVDILFSNDGAASAKAGKVLYLRQNQTYVADFRPTKA